MIPANALSVLTPAELNKVDCFAGVSTGGILALAAAAEYTFAEVEQLYKRWIPEIFKARSWWDKIWRLDEIRRANYDNGGLIRACERVFGDMLMSDLLADVVIPSVHLDGYDPDSGVRCAQTTWHTRNMPEAKKTKVWEVAVKTSSAPVYFPSYKGHVDGGISVNNPAGKAVQLAHAMGYSLENISVLAVTTGSAPLFKDQDRTDWGLLQWGPDIIQMIMRLGEQGSLDLLKLSDLGFYEIADFSLPKQISLDDVKWSAAFNASSYSAKSAGSAIQKFRGVIANG